ncbi:MAG: hypothetical protein J1E33_05365 [Alistipes sp.]|nr:hypothetical protein [Alistipes sp.]
MKKLMLLAVLLCGFAFTAEAQVKVYCKIVERPASSKNRVAIDLGSEDGVFNATEVVGKKDKVAKFESGIAALNFMSQNGWQFVQAYVTVAGAVSEDENNIVSGRTSSECHYLMCKEFASVEDAEAELAAKFVRNKQFK